jgi:molybdate transport system substrate-binding protein
MKISVNYLIKLLKKSALPCALLLLGISVAQADTTVFAAASLKEALDEVAAKYRAGTNEKIAISYASSSALARQIENGAPADVFVSADLDWMDYVEKRGLIRAGTRGNLLRNELVLIAPAGSQAPIPIVRQFPLASLLGTGRLAMGDPDHVPAGKYGKAALEFLGVWPSVADRIARAENVRAALIFVARGEAPFGIVYRTDAAADKNVRVVGVFPANSHPPVVYPAAMLMGGRNAGAEKFFSFLKSPEAMSVYRKHGFLPY